MNHLAVIYLTIHIEELEKMSTWTYFKKVNDWLCEGDMAQTCPLMVVSLYTDWMYTTLYSINRTFGPAVLVQLLHWL